MNATLQLAATKWARAVRERQAATAALRRAKEAARDALLFSQERLVQNACDDRAVEARKQERRAVKELLKVIEHSGTAADEVIDV